MQQRRTGDANIDKIENVFRQEREIRDAVLEAMVGAGGHTGGGSTGHSFISDPTAATALKRAELDCVILPTTDRIFRPTSWLAVIDAVRSWCGRDTIKAELFRRRYAVGESRHSTCREINIEKSTYYAILGEIRNYALQCAAQMQLIRIFDISPYSGNNFSK